MEFIFYDVVGDYFGEMSLMHNEPRKATVKAIGEGVQAFAMSRDKFQSILGLFYI